MTAHRDLAIIIAAGVALFSVYSMVSVLNHTPTPKSRTVIASPPMQPVPPVQMAEQPAAAEPRAVEPVAAGPSPAETAPAKAVVSNKRTVGGNHVKRKIRRIARAKDEPCVGPLCVLVR